ncbi:hypothetical protein HD806DRAFT_489556 [Xylariaceae sp. AK1471]|nr:hypothetical protein HD806DRAFT_489556 [Xylariaceae sp. AK1471]
MYTYWVTFWLLSLASLGFCDIPLTTNHGSNSTIQPTCNVMCELFFADVTYWDWMHLSGPFSSPLSDIVLATQTVVQVINTVLNTTITQTNNPPGMSPPTNSAGKRVDTITYSRQGQNYTAVVEYPTTFYEWPGSYSWTGTLPIERTLGVTDCVTATATQTTALPSNPQPQTPPTSASSFGPYGLEYTLRPRLDYGGLVDSNKALFKDHPAIQHCTTFTPKDAAIISAAGPLKNGPQLAPFTLTSWTKISSTRFEGAVESAGTPTVSLGSTRQDNTDGSPINFGSVTELTKTQSTALGSTRQANVDGSPTLSAIIVGVTETPASFPGPVGQKNTHGLPTVSGGIIEPIETPISPSRPIGQGNIDILTSSSGRVIELSGISTIPSGSTGQDNTDSSPSSSWGPTELTEIPTVSSSAISQSNKASLTVSGPALGATDSLSFTTMQTTDQKPEGTGILMAKAGNLEAPCWMGLLMTFMAGAMHFR